MPDLWYENYQGVSAQFVPSQQQNFPAVLSLRKVFRYTALYKIIVRNYILIPKCQKIWICDFFIICYQVRSDIQSPSFSHLFMWLCDSICAFRSKRIPKKCLLHLCSLYKNESALLALHNALRSTVAPAFVPLFLRTSFAGGSFLVAGTWLFRLPFMPYLCSTGDCLLQN